MKSEKRIPKQGDIIVRVSDFKFSNIKKGDMKIALEDSSSPYLAKIYTDNTTYTASVNDKLWRFATKLETQAYHSGIKNINQIKSAEKEPCEENNNLTLKEQLDSSSIKSFRDIYDLDFSVLINNINEYIEYKSLCIRYGIPPLTSDTFLPFKYYGVISCFPKNIPQRSTISFGLYRFKNVHFFKNHLIKYYKPVNNNNHEKTSEENTNLQTEITTNSRTTRGSVIRLQGRISRFTSKSRLIGNPTRIKQGKKSIRVTSIYGKIFTRQNHSSRNESGGIGEWYY